MLHQLYHNFRGDAMKRRSGCSEPGHHVFATAAAPIVGESWQKPIGLALPPF
jgi:hypothetical protein